MAAKGLSSHRSRSLLEAGPSVPSPTRMPRARNSHQGAAPDASLALLCGQWATATSSRRRWSCPRGRARCCGRPGPAQPKTPASASAAGADSRARRRTGSLPAPSRPRGCGTGPRAPGRLRRCRTARAAGRCRRRGGRSPPRSGRGPRGGGRGSRRSHWCASPTILDRRDVPGSCRTPGVTRAPSDPAATTASASASSKK